MKKLNILLVTESFYPDGWGGAHTYVYNLVKYLSNSKKFLPFVLTIRPNVNSPHSVRIFRYNSALAGKFVVIRRPILSAINAYGVFKDLLKESRIDILNFHAILPAFGLIFFARLKNIPKIYTFHSSLYEDVRLQLKRKNYLPSCLNFILLHLIRFIEKYVLERCQQIIVLSEYSKNFLIKLYSIRPDKIEVVPGGVDIDIFKPGGDKAILKKALELPKDKIILLTTRRLVSRMGIENLIYAIRGIIKKRKDVQLLIAGGGFLEDSLKDIVRKNNLKEYVEFLGVKDIDELSKFYQAADLFIMPSEYSEWFGLSTLEALASSVPVLATPVGATPEILESLDRNLIFEGTDARSIKQGILKFLDNNKKLEQHSLKCRQYVIDNFTWKKVLSKAEDIFLKNYHKYDGNEN